jgi:hypothetical protein
MERSIVCGYSEKTKQLFMNAAQGKSGMHMGEIENLDGMGEHGLIACGMPCASLFT